MADPMIPKEALDYLKRKTLKPVFSYRDVWNEEHASAFTVAKAMQADVLQDMKDAVEAAIAEGKTFRDFQKELRPVLESKGWWGRKTMTDPVTGETRDAQLGSARRLKTIYDTNIGQAYRAGAWERGQESDAHPYIMYRVGPSRKHREEHLAWDGLILPKDDPFWNTHAPKNGWGCKCYLRYLSRASYERLKANGVPIPRRADGSGGGTRPVKTVRPEIRYKNWVDKRTGRVTRVPEGITPGFEWNPGSFSRTAKLTETFREKVQGLALKDKAMQGYFDSPIIREDYQRFVRQAFSAKRGTGQVSVVGYLPDWMIGEIEKRGGKAESGLLGIEERLLRDKNKKHGAAGLSEAEWMQLPDWIRDYDALVWDSKNNGPAILKEIGQSVMVIALGTGNTLTRGRSSFAFDSIRSVYKRSENLTELLARDRLEIIRKGR